MDNCYNCDSSNIIFIKGEFKKICPVCGAWFVDTNEDTDFHSLYSKKYFEGDEYLNYELGKSVHKKNFVKKIKILDKYLAKEKIRILEIGSATGEFLKVANDFGIHQTMGIEISAFARDKALEQGIKLLAPTDPSILVKIREFKPNLIVAWDVWEHLEYPTSIMKEYLQLGTSDVIFALTTVDAGSSVAIKRQEKWRQFHPPTHINYPTKKSFEIFFKNNKFKVMNVSYFGYFRPLAVYLAALIGPRGWIKNSNFLFNIPMYLNLYDTQMVIAKRIDGTNK